MNEDADLLRRYVDGRSESAFAELVARHVDLVYSAALRLVNGDAHRAQDVTQQVFTELARLAKPLRDHPTLVGWLYTTTRFVALRITRTEHRRKAREQEAHAMNELQREPESSTDWTALRPVLEEAMHELNEGDRLAVLLRFFQNKSFQEVGATLGINENAARMRVDRALDKLQALLARRGITSAGTALAALLSTQTVGAAPPTFAANLASVSLAGAATGTTANSLLAFKLMATTKLKGAVIVAAFAGLAGTLLVQHQAQLKLRQENQSLHDQVARLESDRETFLRQWSPSKRFSVPTLPAPAFHVATTNTDPFLESTNLYARLLRDTPRLTSEQAEKYLGENGRSAGALLAAFRCTRDVALLEEAKQKFPNDPQVAFEAAFKSDIPPEERRQWIEIWKQSDPENPLADYLSASEYFKSGRADQAIEALVAASGKQKFTDYTLDRAQNDEEAYLSAGYSVAEAKMIPALQLLLPQLAELKQICLSSVDLANSYRQAGDASSADALLQMAVNMGEHFDGSRNASGTPLITQLVGIAVERIALKAMDPALPYGVEGQTVNDRLHQLAQRSKRLNEIATQIDELTPRMSERDYISYKDRWLRLGEESAAKWAVEKYGHQ
jgi:RNA polymerase sigma factor (sigma-70 family)